MAEEFDHGDHVHKLAEAERELLAVGKPELAAAVMRARMIHHDVVSRIYAAMSVARELNRAADQVRNAVGNIEQYVTKPHGPWIGPDLFPKKES